MSLTGALAYKKLGTSTDVESADPHKLIQMLLEGAIEKVSKAKGFMLNQKLAEKGEHISWAMSIIGGLQASLDKTMDNDIVNNLDALYDFCIHHLLEANVNNEPQMLDDVLAVLNNIQEGWSGIREQALEQWKNN